jgi:hypothetical protein
LLNASIIGATSRLTRKGLAWKSIRTNSNFTANLSPRLDAFGGKASLSRLDGKDFRTGETLFLALLLARFFALDAFKLHIGARLTFIHISHLALLVILADAGAAERFAVLLSEAGLDASMASSAPELALTARANRRWKALLGCFSSNWDCSAMVTVLTCPVLTALLFHGYTIATLALLVGLARLRGWTTALLRHAFSNPDVLLPNVPAFATLETENIRKARLAGLRAAAVGQRCRFHSEAAGITSWATA